MTAILNITNGDSAVGGLREAGIPGDFLAWRDVLHDGPVPAGLELAELSALRVRFLARHFGAPSDSLRADFLRRDAKLAGHGQYDRVVLWFEHDLYDQLQVLQLLDWFSRELDPGRELAMVCTDCYLGEATRDQLRGLARFEAPVSEAQLALAARAWSAFRAPAPGAWLQLLGEETSALPFLHGAVLRMLEEFPDHRNGLSRTAQAALDIVRGGESRLRQVFRAYQGTEERRFMGDWSFRAVLRRLLGPPAPLLRLARGATPLLPPQPDQLLELTATGEQVLAARANWLDLAGIDVWIGGVHLTGERCWCWDAACQTLRARP